MWLFLKLDRQAENLTKFMGWSKECAQEDAKYNYSDAPKTACQGG